MKNFDKAILLSIPLISISAEIIKSFFENSDVMVGRTILCMVLVMMFFFKHLLQVLKFNKSLLLLIAYLLTILFAQETPLQSFQSWILFTESKMLLPLAFVVLANQSALSDMSRVVFWIGVLFTISIIYFLIMNVGVNQYGGEDGFTVGSFKFNRLYTGSFILLSLPLIFQFSKRPFIRRTIPVLSLLLLIILIISTRRTAFIIILTGSLVFAVYYFRKLPAILLGLAAILIVLASAFPLYKDILLKQIEKRQHVFVEQQGFDLKSETRFEETIAVWRERIHNRDPWIIFFGQDLFNSAGNYDQGVHGTRPLHLDINLILHGSGLIGLILFILFYSELVFTFFKWKARRKNPASRLTEATGGAIIASLIVLTFSGGMLAVTHQMIACLITGACLGNMASGRFINRKSTSESKSYLFPNQAFPVFIKNYMH